MSSESDRYSDGTGHGPRSDEMAYQASLGDDFGVDLGDRRRRARRILDRHNPAETHGGLITPETVARRVLHFPTSRAADYLGWAENEIRSVETETDHGGNA